jgi:aldehyde dehydrogenase (NAD+)
MTLENTRNERIDSIFASQKAYFASEETRNVKFRKKQLRALLDAMEKHEQALADALWTDLHKSYEEAYLTELSLVKAEIRQAIKKTSRWARRERKASPVTIFGSKSYVVNEPLGCSLIVSPWNYPVQLLLNPLVGAIAAGCTAVLKPSPYVPHVSQAIEAMISEAFEEKYIAVVQGNRDVNKKLFGMKWDIIFFTGSPALARNVAKAAADNLVPMVLELGGKSPCIIDKSANLDLAALRCAWGKTLNAGQTCIAPDYILIHKDVKEEFVKKFAESIKKLHGEEIKESRHYVRMVTDKAFERVASYIGEGKVLYGGRTDERERFIEPTLLGDVKEGADVLTTEIFGPVFPMIEFDGQGFEDQVVKYITEREKPLALYYFGNEKDGWKIIRRTSSGGACINDTIMHIANPNVPFGGVGNSGMGSYHGVLSFEAFSHKRSVVATPTFFDLPFRYMPYKTFGMVKKLV